jgi:hypothetical protein
VAVDPVEEDEDPRFGRPEEEDDEEADLSSLSPRFRAFLAAAAIVAELTVDRLKELGGDGGVGGCEDQEEGVSGEGRDPECW